MIHRKSRHEINLMQTAGSIVAEALQEVSDAVKPGVTTEDLDKIAFKVIDRNHAIPTFKGYHGYPASICASVNNEVVHGIPSNNTVLKEGDIISLDIGATYKGLVGDSAITVGVGKISADLENLIKVTRESLYDAIEKVVAGHNLQEVSGAVEDKARMHGFGIVTQYGGHGVGRSMHEEPFVFNYRTGHPGPVLKPGMTIAIEPMLNLGTGDVHTLEDGWTVVTDDGLPSAHFEHTVLVTEDGPQILTLKK